MGDEQERTMYVGNLHDDVTEALLYELFLQAGPLQRISRPKDRESGKVKNFAFVVFVHAASVPYAIHLTNGIKLIGRPLKSQQRNNLDLQHYSTVGVHSIECENKLQRTLDGSQEEDSMEDYSSGNGSANRSRSNSYKRARVDSSGSSFTPQPLDPNQTWKNNIHYHERQQQEQQHGSLVSNVMMAGPVMDMSPNTGRRHQGSGSRYHQDQQLASVSSSPARSASHYHNLNSQILSSDLRSRLGDGGKYRSTRDSGYYGGSPYNAGYGNYGDGHNSSYNSNNSSGYGSSNTSYDNGAYYSNRGYNNSSGKNYSSSRGYNNNDRGYNNSSRYDDKNSHNKNRSGSYGYGYERQ